MAEWLPAIVVFAYLLVALTVGLLAGRQGEGGVSDFVAGDRAFGPVLMYFVIGATIFSAYALLGTPQRIVTKGSDVAYVFAYGAVGLVPLYFFGPKVRRIGAAQGFVTQAEFVGARFESRAVTGVMGVATLVAFLPYVVIQLRGAGLVMEYATGLPQWVGAGLVYGGVAAYVAFGGMRGVGWTNVLQGVAMLAVVWGLGLWIPIALYGGVAPMFDRVIEQHPEYLTLPGPGDQTSPTRYTSEVLVSVLGFTMWPQIFMKCFTARSARLVQLSVVLYPTFLLFLLPLVFLGYTAVLEGGPGDDSVLLWLADLPSTRGLGGGLGSLASAGVVQAALAFAVLAASMSTGDALLHGGGSIFVRDVLVGAAGMELDEGTQTRVMRVMVLVLGSVGVGVLAVAGSTSVVDLLLLAYAVPIQFLPLVLAGLYWRRANRVGAIGGLCAGLSTVLLLFGAGRVAPGLAGVLNPLGLEIGVVGVAVNVAAMVILSLVGPTHDDQHLSRFEL